MNWIWFFIRVTGLTAYLLLTLSLLAGIMRQVVADVYRNPYFPAII
ncbi:hypothetical protein [Fictibacillus sp. KU28468]|nr:hypothetical protein [Fictibacillus sp. KU28468]UZJ79858.1 hypothetical protein OKX00_05125 [Fictibacillus sp. KU28468]